MSWAITGGGYKHGALVKTVSVRAEDSAREFLRQYRFKAF